MASRRKQRAKKAARGFGAWLARTMPTRKSLSENKYLKPIAGRFLRSELWRFTRRSVPRGVALGLFSAFIIPVGQIFLAAFLALPARANVPVAVMTTFVTNPLTIPFWFFAANRLGEWSLQLDDMTFGEPIQTGLNNRLGEWLVWLGREAGATAFGFLVLALVSAALGYVLSSWCWQAWIGYRRARLLRIRKTQQRG